MLKNYYRNQGNSDLGTINIKKVKMKIIHCLILILGLNPMVFSQIKDLFFDRFRRS